jgi:hypothetical protein
MTMLKDAPGAASLLYPLAEAAKLLSLLYAGTPDERARPHLQTFTDAIEPSLVEAVGAIKAPIILNALRGAVINRKHEIEAGGASRA